jgi:hypothetical protein
MLMPERKIDAYRWRDTITLPEWAPAIDVLARRYRALARCQERLAAAVEAKRHESVGLPRGPAPITTRPLP